jgi:hypothetical protein
MLLLIPLILIAIPAILLGINLAVIPPTNTDYSAMAYNKAMSAYYETGSAPTTATVMGATINVGTLDTSDLSYQALDNLVWKRINAEQAILTVCNQVMTACNDANLGNLWSFLPANTGTVQSLLSPSYTGQVLNCSNPTTYPPYELDMLQQALRSQDLSHTVGGKTYNLYYNKPTSGVGCFFQDIVYAQ